jgi:hypothetical protein
LSGWTRKVDENNVKFALFDEMFALPKLSVTIETSLNFLVSVYNWLLPDDHTIYLTHKRSIQYFTLSSLLSSLQELQLCGGL